MDIIKMISAARLRFELDTGKKATNIYLGYMEIKFFRTLINSYAGFNHAVFNAAGKNLEFDGMKVFEVREERHLSVSYQGGEK